MNKPLSPISDRDRITSAHDVGGEKSSSSKIKEK